MAGVGLAALGFAAHAQQQQIDIAGLFAVTGSNTNFGVAYTDGLKLAAKEINDRGGVKADGTTYRITLSLADTQGDPARAVSEAQRLLASGTRIFFCCNLSAEAVPVLKPVLARGGIVVSQNSATAKFLGQPGHELQFKSANVEAGPRGSVEQWVRFVVRKYPEAKTVAIIVPSDESGQTYADTYSASFTKNGFRVVALERYDHGRTDFSSQLTNIKAAQPQLLVAGYSDEAKGIFRQARELGIPAKFVGTQGVSGDSFTGHDEYLITGVRLGAEQTDARINDFSRKLEAFRGGSLTPFSYYSIATYDWLNIVARAIEQAGTARDLKAVAAKIRNTRYDGVQSYEIDDTGLARASTQALYFKDGKLEVTTLEVPR